MKLNKGMFTSDSETWETPWDLFDKLNEEFHFTMDVCADVYNSKCPRFFDKETDGLKQPWEGFKCWMNPPYGKVIGKWIEKAFTESLKGVLVVGLLPARTDTRWFHEWIYNKTEIRFIRGRLKFSNSINSAPFPSMIVIWR